MDDGVAYYQLFLQGDEQGLVELIHLYKDGLMLYINRIVSDIFIAEELTEDVFLRLVLKKPKFAQRASFKTWLYTIGRNLAVDHMRRCRRIPFSLEDRNNYTDQTENLEEVYIRQQNKLTVHRLMKGLKQEYRQVLWLIYFEGFTCAQTGKIMGKSRHNIETMVYRARQALKAKLIQEGYNYEKL